MTPTPSDPSTPAGMPSVHRWLLLTLSLILLILGFLPRELWGTDESILGTIVREMVVDGQWLVPHLNQVVYPDKPPLYYWLAALPSLASGTLTPLWLRLPATLAAIGCLWVTYRLGALLLGSSGGMLAAVILATSPLFVISAQIARMDMVITFLTTAILYCFARGMQGSATARRWWYLSIYPLAGLAFLTKGLIGPAIPAFVIGSMLLWQRDWRFLIRLQVGWGLLLAGGMVLPWLIPAIRQEDPGYLWDLLIKQSLGRAVHSFAHDRPFYYYVATVPPTFLPWVLFLPGAFILMWRRFAAQDWRLPLMVGWTMGLFLFFSAVSGKLVIYLLPIFPALAIVVALLWQEAFETTDALWSRRHLLWPVLIAVSLFVTAAIGAAVGRLLPPEIPPALLFGYAGTITAITTLGLSAGRWPFPSRLFGITLITIGLTLGMAKSVTQTMSGLFPSPAALGRALTRYHDTVPAMATYRMRPGLLNFYAGGRFEDLNLPDDARRFLAQETPALCILKESDLNRLWETLPPDLRVIEQAHIGPVAYLVIANAKVP